MECPLWRLLISSRSVSKQQLNSVILIKPWYCCHNQVPSFPHYWLVTRVATRVTQWVQLVKQELLTFPKHLMSPPGFLWDSSYSILFSVYCFVTISCSVDRALKVIFISWHLKIYPNDLYFTSYIKTRKKTFQIKHFKIIEIDCT
jgi:hypothetical protein